MIFEKHLTDGEKKWTESILTPNRLAATITESHQSFGGDLACTVDPFIYCKTIKTQTNSWRRISAVNREHVQGYFAAFQCDKVYRTHRRKKQISQSKLCIA
ncbi:uncharacterized protein LOC110117554 [Ceratitis capitata]|uniref:uncharacterized protein LOC110117554 n=1 Tax=Ceratitis capitata TaxID=7213 RepID=UPI000A100014|nr:uncharacterized protein LOC110117554 [Ceratitis capitata]